MGNTSKPSDASSADASEPSRAPFGLGLRVRGAGTPPAPRLALGDPLLVKSVYFHAKQVTLDGYRFEECRFDKCTLVVHSSNFTLERCVVDPACVIRYGGSLIRVIQLFTSRYDWLTESLPGLAPTRHADGTISIGT